MKRSLYIFLAAACVASPAYAAPLNPDDWEVIEGAEPPEDEECFTFTDGKLIATGNTNGKELFYKVNVGTNPMVNGSGLSITLQFNNKSFLAESDSEFHIIFHTDNSAREGGGKDVFHVFYVRSDKNGENGPFNIYDSATLMDHYFSLEDADTLTTVTVNYGIKDNKFCFSYTLNGSESDEFIYEAGEINPTLDWRPSFGLANSESNAFTVTDVTFYPAVPEPSTATLSLLALAALAARRRRK